MRPRAVELLARLVERGVMVCIVDTLRTEAEQAEALRAGRSATRWSRHLPRRLRRAMPPGDPDADKADAMDLAPYAIYALHGPDKLQWDTTDVVWRTIGELAESLGLVWGGRWQHPHDPGHVELPRAIWEGPR